MAPPQPPPTPHAPNPRRISVARRATQAIVAVALAVSVPMGVAGSSPAAAACGSFQALVDAAPSGGTIAIPVCTYHEIVRVTKPLTINAAGVVIDGDNVRDLGIAVLANDVTVNGLTVTHIMSGPHIGAVWTTGVSRFTFRGGVARDSATVCVSLNGGTGHRVIDSELAGCGKEGYFMNGVSDTLFSGNRIHDNNTGLAFDPAVEAGGGKTMASQRVSFTGNEVDHNGGPGIWFDNNAVDVTATGNRVHHNYREGIFFEISDGAQISGNAVWENGWGFVAWGYGAGIIISSSDRAIVSGNTVAWNARGISVISQNRELSPHNGNVIHDNVIVATAGSFVTGFYDDHGGTLFDAGNANGGYGNRYWVGTAEPSSDRFEWAGERKSLAEYNATPGEQDSSYLTATQRDGALAAAGMPGADGSQPPASVLPSPTPSASPTPGASPTPDPGATPAPTPPGSSPPPDGALRAAIPLIAFGSGQMGANASLPGRVTWATTAGAGAYQLQVQRNGGSWTSLFLASATARSATLRFFGDERYRARLRVQAPSGAWSTWAYSASSGAHRYQESGSAVSYGGSWKLARSDGSSGGYVRFKPSIGSTATFRFTGRAVAWIAPRGQTRGSAAIYIDGVRRATVSLFGAASFARTIAYTTGWSSAGAHTLTVKVLGTAGHPRIDVDAFAVLH